MWLVCIVKHCQYYDGMLNLDLCHCHNIQLNAQLYNHKSTCNTTNNNNNNNNDKYLESVSCWVSRTSSEGSSVTSMLSISGGTYIKYTL